MMPQGRLVHPATATGPGAGISAVHFLETRPVPLALVLQHPQKVAPTCIAERTGQTAVPHHATDMQGFDLHHGTSLGYRTGGLVVAVLPDMLHAGMESTADLIETVAVLGLPGAVYLAGTGDGLVHTPELGQGCLQGSGIRIYGALGQGSLRFDTHVDAHRSACPQRRGCDAGIHLAGSKPAVRFPVEGNGHNRPGKPQFLPHPDPAEAPQVDFPTLHADGVAPIGGGIRCRGGPSCGSGESASIGPFGLTSGPGNTGLRLGWLCPRA